VEDGIRVNSICPGNFFEGPLRSDPQSGLLVRFLTSGKVPGAKTRRCSGDRPRRSRCIARPLGTDLDLALIRIARAHP
jgi:NAD(P)-dependent dehydrogenase (short-subunit alcohol dehydrogenase family)